MWRKRLLKRLALVTDNDRYRARLQRSGGREHVLDHGCPGHTVEHLWQRGFHPGALSRRQNNDVEIGHGPRPSLVKAEPQLSRGTRSKRTPALGSHHRRRLERRGEGVVAS